MTLTLQVPGSADAALEFFLVGRRLGAGGMGEVYFARDESLGRPVALKVLRPGLAQDAHVIERFNREARAAAQLSHPNIVQIHTVGSDDGITYMAMEYVDGSPLDAVLREHRALPWQRALNITGQIASALELAHSRGIIHRDIKPANILIDRHGRARVTDFGVAKIIGANTKLTTDGAIIGTPAYMSPEQCGIGEVQPASDLFSLGAMLYEMLSGSLPFRGNTYAGIIRSVAQDTPRPLNELVAGVPQNVRRLVDKLLDKKPEQRYGSATELLSDLAQITTARTPPAAAPDGRGSASPTLQLSPVRTLTLRHGILAAVVLVAIAGIIAVGVRGRIRAGVPGPPIATPSDAPVATTSPAVEPLPEAPDPVPSLSPKDLLARHDTNHDGMIEESEMPKEIRLHLKQVDTNGDRVLTMQELQAVPNRRRLPRAGIKHPPLSEGRSVSGPGRLQEPLRSNG